jgi:dTDP-4-dehydrorhamnose reductase
MSDHPTAPPFARPILITGAAGQLGSAVLDTCAGRGIDAVGLTRAELDVADETRVLELVRELRPSAIIHCAAYTNVDGAESDRAGAFRVNEQGSRVIARAAKATGAHLVAVSTDYVFPGTAPDGYAEDDATGPINVYGESKLAGELAIREELGDEHACIARTAWLFSAQPPNFVQTIARAAVDRDSLDVVDDQRGNPTWCGHLAEALVTCAIDKVCGTHHLVDLPAATWFELAQDVVEELGSSCEVRPTTSDAFVRPAARATVSVLRSTRPDTPHMGTWRDGVRESLRLHDRKKLSR